MKTSGFKNYFALIPAIAILIIPVVALAETDATTSVEVNASGTVEIPSIPKKPGIRGKIQQGFEVRKENIGNNRDLRNNVLERQKMMSSSTMRAEFMASTSMRGPRGDVRMQEEMMRHASGTPRMNFIKRLRKEEVRPRQEAVLKGLGLATTTLARAHDLQKNQISEIAAKGIATTSLDAEFKISHDMIMQANIDVMAFANWKPQTTDASGTVEVIKPQELLVEAKHSVIRARDSVREVGFMIKKIRKEIRVEASASGTTTVQ